MMIAIGTKLQNIVGVTLLVLKVVKQLPGNIAPFASDTQRIIL